MTLEREGLDMLGAGALGRKPAATDWTGRLAPPVLLLAALLFGAGIAAVVFVGFWKRADTNRQATQSRLALANRQLASVADARGTLEARNRALQRALASSQAQIEALTATSATRAHSVAVLRRQATALRAQVAAAAQQVSAVRSQLGQASAAASTVSVPAGKLASALASLADYLARTDATSVDPAFLRAQLAYLQARVSEVRSAADAVAAAAGSQ